MPRPSRWNEIVQAAAEEFRSRGYHAAKLEDIAARVGILKGSLYNYIENKDDLLFAVIEEPAQLLLNELERIKRDSGHSATRRLRRLIHAQIDVFNRHFPAAFVYLHQINSPTHRADFREMDARYLAAVRELIEDGIHRGEFSRTLDADLSAKALIGMIDWMSYWYVPRSREDDAKIADHFFALALGGLAAGGVVWALGVEGDS